MSFELIVIMLLLMYLFGISLSIALLTVNTKFLMNDKKQFTLLYLSLIPIVQFFIIFYLFHHFVKNKRKELPSSTPPSRKGLARALR